MSAASGLVLVLAACGTSLAPVSAHLSLSSDSITQEGPLTLTAQVSGNAAKVRFLEGGTTIAEKTAAPFSTILNLTTGQNGTKEFGLEVLDGANNVVAHSKASVVVNIPVAQAKETSLTLSLSRKATLEADANGMASYYCRMAICAGDDGSDQAVRAFLEFSLANLPANLQSANITSATLRVYQNESTSTYSKLGGLHFEHVNYGQTPTFDAPVLRSLGLNPSGSQGYKEVSVLEAVRDDWANRSSRDNHSQYRLRMDKPTNGDSSSDLVLFGDADPVEYSPQLVIRYKLP